MPNHCPEQDLCFGMGAVVAWHLRNFRSSRLTPTDFEVIFTNGTHRALFYKVDPSYSLKNLNTSPKERMLRIVFDTVWGDWSQCEKFSEIKPPLKSLDNWTWKKQMD